MPWTWGSESTENEELKWNATSQVVLVGWPCCSLPARACVSCPVIVYSPLAERAVTLQRVRLMASSLSEAAGLWRSSEGGAAPSAERKGDTLWSVSPAQSCSYRRGEVKVFPLVKSLPSLNGVSCERDNQICTELVINHDNQAEMFRIQRRWRHKLLSLLHHVV